MFFSMDIGACWRYVWVELSLEAHGNCAGICFLCGTFCLLWCKRKDRSIGLGMCVVAKEIVGGLSGSRKRKKVVYH